MMANGQTFLGTKFLPSPISIGTVSPRATIALFRELSFAPTKPGIKPWTQGDVISPILFYRKKMHVQTIEPQHMETGLTKQPGI